MPTYDYKCPKCDRVTESFHKMCEQIEIICPECNEKMDLCIRLGSAIHFKGTGFYVTDYKGN